MPSRYNRLHSDKLVIPAAGSPGSRLLLSSKVDKIIKFADYFESRGVWEKAYDSEVD